MHGFTDGWVGEHGLHQFRLGGLQLAGDDIALDHLRHLRADHMRAQQFTGFGIKNGFYQAFRLAHGDGLAVADEGEAADFQLIPGFLGFRLGQPDAGHLRPAIGATWDVAGLERVRVFASDVLYANHTFMRRLMRQPGRPGNVADGIHARLAGAAKAVHHDMRAFHFYLRAFQAEVFDVTDDAHGGNYALNGNLLLLAAGFHRHGHAIGALLHALHGG